MNEKEETEYEKYIRSPEYKKSVKIIFICLGLILLITLAVIFLTTPHYSEEYLKCMQVHKWEQYMCKNLT